MAAVDPEVFKRKEDQEKEALDRETQKNLTPKKWLTTSCLLIPKGDCGADSLCRLDGRLINSSRLVLYRDELDNCWKLCYDDSDPDGRNMYLVKVGL